MSNQIVAMLLLITGLAIAVVWISRYITSNESRVPIVLRVITECGGEAYSLQILAKSDGELDRGSLYVTLRGMEDLGLLTSFEVIAGGRGGRPRRYYRLTEEGKQKMARSART